jgi:hypothetical protein
MVVILIERFQVYDSHQICQHRQIVLNKEKAKNSNLRYYRFCFIYLSMFSKGPLFNGIDSLMK